MQFLRKNPNTRLGYGDDGTEQVKAHKWFRRINWTSIKERKVTPPLKPKIVSVGQRALNDYGKICIILIAFHVDGPRTCRKL